MTDCILEIPEVESAVQMLRLSQFSVDHAADAIFWVARDARIIYANEQAVRSLGYTRKELLTMRVHDIAPLYALENWEQAWRNLREQGRQAVESIHRRKDGTEFPVSVHASYYNDGERELSFACCRDLTEKRAANQPDLSAQRARLTPREQEVMDLLVEGKSVKQIAVELGVGFPTAARHRSRVLEKMQVGNDVELVRLVLLAAS